MKTLAICLLTLVAFTVSASQERDQALEDAVRAKLKSEKLDNEVAEVIATGSAVTLRGKASNVYMKMKTIETALTVEGVETVEDELQVAEAESQEDMIKELRSRVLTYSQFTVFDDVGFLIQDGGIVVLNGYVTEPFKKTELEERVGKVTGVQQLDNVIEVLPVGGTDDTLRRRLFNNIYRNDLFVQYANRAQPPIRIIVKNSSVMLSGAVASRIEKVQAENIARSTAGVINVDNRLEINR